MDIENEYEGKIVLVTGGAGCIGTNLCRKLAELGAEKVVMLDDLSSAYEWNIPRANSISFVNGSILDDEMLKRVFKFKEKPEYVFHLAAHFANQNSVDNPDEVKNHEISRDLHNTFSFCKKENLACAKRKTSLFGLVRC